MLLATSTALLLFLQLACLSNRCLLADAMTSAALANTARIIPDVLPRAFESMGVKTLFEEHANGESLLELFRDFIKEWGNGVTKEIEFNEILNSGKGKETLSTTILAQYENHRQSSSGVAPCLVYGSLFMPPSSSLCYKDPDFRELLQLGALISGLDNDLQSQNKQDDWDYVSILIQKFGYSMEQAIELCSRRHHELMTRYHSSVIKLSSKTKDEKSSLLTMNDWGTTVGPSIFRGFCSWQCHAKRYKNENLDPHVLLEKLFPGEPYHVILADGTSPGFLNVDLRDELNDETLKWAASIGLVGEFAMPEKKFHSMDPALCTLLLYDHGANRDNIALLGGFCRFFVVCVFIDDLWERPELHNLCRSTVFDCVDEFL